MKTAAQLFILFVLLGVNSLGFIYRHDCEMPCCQPDKTSSCCSEVKNNLCELSINQCARSIFIPFPVLPLEETEFNPSLDLSEPIKSFSKNILPGSMTINTETSNYLTIPPLLINLPLLI